ncbi:MAG: hypothetical protein D6761_04330 [Candidatus Dadabacteria bacterium]|nr:MAG: hypothetical protein D6761_04330 [Candidatus Dadabacteria bacterium]
MKRHGMIVVALICFAAPHIAHAQGKGRKGHGHAIPFSQMDRDGDKKVTFDEFVAAQREKLRKRFERIDMNHDGVVTELELEQARSRGKVAGSAGKKPGASQ